MTAAAGDAPPSARTPAADRTWSRCRREPREQDGQAAGEHAARQGYHESRHLQRADASPLTRPRERRSPASRPFAAAGASTCPATGRPPPCITSPPTRWRARRSPVPTDRCPPRRGRRSDRLRAAAREGSDEDAGEVGRGGESRNGDGERRERGAEQQNRRAYADGGAAPPVGRRSIKATGSAQPSPRPTSARASSLMFPCVIAKPGSSSLARRGFPALASTMTLMACSASQNTSCTPVASR